MVLLSEPVNALCYLPEQTMFSLVLRAPLPNPCNVLPQGYKFCLLGFQILDDVWAGHETLPESVSLLTESVTPRGIIVHQKK